MMRALSRTSLAVIVSVSSLAFASAASAANGQWDHAAGFKVNGPVGGANRYAAPSTSYSYGTQTLAAGSTAMASQPAASSAYQRFSYEPSAAVFTTGDRIRVTANSALLMVETQIVGRLSKGERLAVSQIQGPWLWTSVVKDGRTVSGWIRAENVAK